jgi:sulfiredoxin
MAEVPCHSLGVRADGARFVLVEGLHRLEAAKTLGEKNIVGLLVEARKH